jgi:Xaa-Pro aminopeptidase
MTHHDFAGRRARVFDAMDASSAVVLGAAPELRVGPDTDLKYVADADVWYLTGHPEPETVAVLRRAGDDVLFVLFVRPRNAASELWTGARGGVEAAAARYGADEAYPVTELAERLPALLSDCDDVYARLDAGRPEVDDSVRRVIAAGRRSRPRTGRGPFRLIDPGPLLGAQRLFKDAAELEAMREAARITVESFTDAAASISEGAGEWEIEAAIDGGFRRRGATGAAFPTIAASGPNATVLHYIANDRTIGANELVLVDAGARHSMYCADITRTFPSASRFDGAGRAVYDIVLAAHDAAIAAARPGCTIDDVHMAATRVLVQGLLDLGLVDGDVDSLIENDDDVRRFCPHRTSHWLGLDVHDAGAYVNSDGSPRTLEPGMVFTVEPGLYIPMVDDSAAEELNGIGVRIEDDVLITADGHEVLTAALPVAADEVAALGNG